MRVLLISKEGDGLGVAQRLALEGNNVDLWIGDKRYGRAGRGLVNRVPDWRASLRKADLVLCDSVGLGRYEDIIARSGRPSLGFCAALDTIELDRQKGMELFQRAGITTPETVPFATAAEAAKIPAAKGWGDGWVVKSSGNLSAEKTAVVKEEEQWDAAVRQLPPASHGIAQRLVSGIEVSTEGWFNGRNFIAPFNHTFEEKRFLVGGLGQNTGCMGNIVLRSDGNRLTRSSIERVEPFLRLLGYRGPMDINCIVNKDGAYALEATSRMGFDAVEALIEGLEEPVGDFLFDVAMGTRKEMALTTDTMIAVRLSVPPWPVRAPASNSPPLPIRGITEESLYHLFLCDVERQGDDYVTANADGTVLKATAVGHATPPRRGAANGSSAPAKTDYTYEARRRVYRLLDRISVADKQYRTDIGARVNDDIAQLKQWGWL